MNTETFINPLKATANSIYDRVQLDLLEIRGNFILFDNEYEKLSRYNDLYMLTISDIASEAILGYCIFPKSNFSPELLVKGIKNTLIPLEDTDTIKYGSIAKVLPQTKGVIFNTIICDTANHKIDESIGLILSNLLNIRIIRSVPQININKRLADIIQLTGSATYPFDLKSVYIIVDEMINEYNHRKQASLNNQYPLQVLQDQLENIPIRKLAVDSNKQFFKYF